MLAVEDLDDEPAIHQQGRRRVAPLQPEEAVLLLQVMSPDHLYIHVQGGDDSPDGDRPYQHAIRHRRGGGVVVLAVHVSNPDVAWSRTNDLPAVNWTLV